MFARITRTESAPDKVAQMTTVYEHELVPQIRNLAGFAGAILSADRGSGAAMSVTFWESEEAMRASEQTADSLRGQATQTMAGRVRDVERYEIVLREGSAPPQANTFVRVNQVHGSPDKTDDGIQFVRDQVVPLTKPLSGFRALVMGVNRQNGRAFVTSVWASAADREASEAAVREQRRQAGQVTGADQVQVELYETVFAEVNQATMAALP